MSEFEAEAIISVRADTKPFLAEFERAAKQVEKRKIVVRLEASTVGFRNDLLTKLQTASKGVSVKVLVRADMTGFRADLITKVNAAAKGITVPVAATVTAARGAVVAPAGATGAATSRAQAAAATEKLTAAEKKLAEAESAIAFARQRAIGGTIEERRLDRLARQTQAAVVADQAYKAALKEGNAALLSRAVALQGTTKAAVTQTKGVIESAAAKQAAVQERAAAKQQAIDASAVAAEKEKQAQITAAFEQAEAERAAFAQRQRAVANAQIATFFKNQEVAAKRSADFAKEASKFEIGQDVSRLAAQDAAGAKAAEAQRKAAAKAAAADTRLATKAERELQKAREQSAISALPIVGAKTAEAQAAKQLAISERALASLTKAEAAAHEINDAALKQETLDRIAATRVAAEQTVVSRSLALQTAREAAARAAANKSVKESVIANTLSMLGLRGSALAANVAFLATSAAVLSLAKSVGLAAKLESQLNVFRVTAGATGKEMAQVSATAQQLGRDITLPGVGAQDAAQALTELSKAGLSVQDSIDGARGVLQLATAAAIDNAQATELVASALNAFGLAGDQAVRVADVLANAANDAQGSITDMGIALQQSAGVARQAGLSLEETVAALTLFARSGLRGSDAGTSLRTALIRLINPSKKAQEEIQRLGLHVRTATGGINLGVFDEFARKTKLLTNAQRDQTLAIIFGQDAIRGAAILAREGKQGLDQQITSLEKSGTAAAVAGARMAGVAGAAENLKNQLAALGTVIGQQLTPALNFTADLLANMTSGFTSAVDGAEALGNKINQVGKIIEDSPAFQIKIGPIDTKALDKEVGSFLKRAAPKLALAAVSPGGFTAFAASQGAEQIKNMRRLKGDTEGVREEVNKILTGLRGTNEVTAAISFTAVVGQLTELQQKLAGGDKNAQRLSDEVGKVISQLKEGTALPPFLFPKVTLPPDLRSGRPGKQAGDAITAAFDAALPGPKIYGISFNAFLNIGKGIDAAVASALDTITTAIPNAMALVQSLLNTGINKTIKSADRNIARLSERALDIELAGGTPQQRINNLKSEFAQQQRKIDATEGKTGKEFVATRRAAKERQIAINQEIKSIEDDRKNKAQAAADKIKQARSDADQAFLNALEAGRTPFQRRITKAGTTEGEADDVAALVAMRKRIQREIALVKTGVKDSKTKTQQLQKLSDDLFQNGLDLQAARKRRNDAIVQAFTDRGQAIQSLGDTTGNLKLVIKGLDLQIKAARETLLKAKAAKIGIEAANAALEQLKKTRRETIQQARDTLLGEAFRFAEAKGDQGLMVKIIDLQIAEARRALSKAKSAVDRYTALANIQELINKKKEILADKVQQGQQGTTVFELLQQNAETFKANAGNLISGNQPFAGPAGFTTDIAQFLIRQRQTGAGGARSNLRPDVTPGSEDIFFRGTPAQQRQETTTLALIAALKQLTDATLEAGGKKGNASTATPTFGGVPTGSLADRFLDATRARKVRESGV